MATHETLKERPPTSHGIDYSAHAHFPQENGQPYVWLSTEQSLLDLCNGAVSEKTPQIFGPPLPAEYVTVF